MYSYYLIIFYFAQQYMGSKLEKLSWALLSAEIEVQGNLPDLLERSFRNELGEEKAPLNSKMFNDNTRETLICTITIYIFP